MASSLGSYATGFGADQSIRSGMGSSRGRAIAPCSRSVTDAWLLGGSSLVGHLTTILLVNNDDRSAQVDLEIFGADGQISSPGATGIAVAGDVGDALDAFHPLPDQGRPGLQQVQIGAGQGVLQVGIALPPAAAQILRGEHEQADAGDAAEIAAQGGRAMAIRTDVGKEEDVEALFDAAERAFGAVDLLVNAAGPWVDDVLARVAGGHAKNAVRLVKGSHIVVPRLYAGDHAFMLQNPDRRIVFAIPYEGEFTEIGTTDIPVDRPEDAVASGAKS